jgi:ferredoxin
MLVVTGVCDGCGTCIAVCPANALILNENSLEIDHARCTECGICVSICPFSALEVNDED